jgi:hypothetical protein
MYRMRQVSNQRCKSMVQSPTRRPAQHEPRLYVLFHISSFQQAHNLHISGLKNDWAVTPLIPATNAGVSYTIPACLKSGYYLVRHEIIALHSAYDEGGAQFYPGCHQLKVSGEGSKTPSRDLVSFPGAYDSKDPGLVFSIYNRLPYNIPGPQVFTCE